MRKFWLWVSIIFCLPIFSVAFYKAVVSSSVAAYTFAGLPFIAVFALFAVGVLEYKVGGATISLESKVQDLEQRNKELSKVVQSLVRCLVVVRDGAGRYNGPGKLHKKLMSEYLSHISEHLDPELVESTQNTIDQALASLQSSEY